jgi:hypothetical protein
MSDHAFEDLWADGVAARTERFDPARIAKLPEPARRYLRHAVAPGALIATAVRLRMRGEIRLKDSWYPFAASQVIRWDRGFVWKARVTMKGLPVTGSDRWVDGEGSMRWRLLGLVPLMSAAGPDISRAALGRVQIESVWLPTVLLAPDVVWNAADPEHLGVDLHLSDHAAHLDLGVGSSGTLCTASIARWGNPEASGTEPGSFHEYPFGCLVSGERTFAGITIPTVLRVGWFFGTDRFESEGEFFRVTVDQAEFR